LGGGGNLTQAEAFEHGAQLPSGHGHAGIKIGTECRCLADRHIMPILEPCLSLGRARRGDTSAPRSDCWWRSRTTSASWASTRRHGTFLSRAEDTGLGHAPPWVGSCSPVWARSLVPWHSCSASPGGRFGCSYGSSTRCARFRGNALPELRQWLRRCCEAGRDAFLPDHGLRRLNPHEVRAIDRRQDQTGAP
jgi:hypothetical protein